MFKSIIASAALLASTVAASGVGSAIVVNACSYEVYIFNTPAAGGGYSAIDTTLSPGQQYKQQWTELSNGDGWSIKLSQVSTLGADSIMQYEYTWHDDGIIWYDLSDVNGNPWDGNWEITATNPENTCAPKQQAYRYSTDDAYGMQACPQDATITVTLCSGDSSDDAAASAAASSVAALSTSQVAATSSQAAYTSVAATSATAKSTVVTTPTTFATLTTATSANAAGSTVTSVATAVVTEVTTNTYYNNDGYHWYTKRHEHHPHHAHGR